MIRSRHVLRLDAWNPRETDGSGWFFRCLLQTHTIIGKIIMGGTGRSFDMRKVFGKDFSEPFGVASAFEVGSCQKSMKPRDSSASSNPLGTRQSKNDPNLKVAICCITRQRAKMLSRLLASWASLQFQDDIQPVFIVVENDHEKPSEQLVLDMGSRFGRELLYFVEPEVGIPYARNKAVREAILCGARLIAFADDDETVSQDWFWRLYETHMETGAQLVGGPVRVFFASHPRSLRERVLMRGIADRYERVERNALDKLRRGKTDRLAVLTNNWLADSALFTQHGLMFDSSLRFTGGSDSKFFRDALSKGVKTSWSPKAVVYETVPDSRVSFGYQFRRGKEQSKTSIRAKMATHGRWKVLPMMVLSIAVRGVGAVVAFTAMPFTRGGSLVRGVRSCGWITGRVAGYCGRQSNLYRDITGE